MSFKKFLQHPVLSNAIGGIVAATVIAFAGIVYRNSWWPAVRRGVSGAWAHLFTASALPHWALGLFILGAVLFVLLLAAVIVIALQAKKQNQSPDWLSYTSDSFHGLKWVWTYEGREPRLMAVVCPRCDYQLVPNSTSMFDSSVRFRCDNCGRNFEVQEQSWDSLQSVVMRLIHQKLRTGTYPRARRLGAA